VLVGLNEKQLKTLPKNIIGICRTNSIQELAEIYTAADVFVNPTLEDNFPTTNIEALACGTPVITFNTGGSPEIIDDTCGIVVEKGDMNKLIEAIIGLYENNFSKDNCVSQALHFGKNEKYFEYIELYKQIMIK